jgi:hypothetical protein
MRDWSGLAAGFGSLVAVSVLALALGKYRVEISWSFTEPRRVVVIELVNRKCFVDRPYYWRIGHL